MHKIGGTNWSNNNNNATREVATTEETPTSLANLQKEVDHIKQTNTNVSTNIINNKPTDQIAIPTRKTLQANKLLKMENTI